MKDKLLVHACCGPCLVGVYEDIEKNTSQYGIQDMSDIDVIWYNINIHPMSEYEKRKETLKEFLGMKNKEGIFLDEYNVMDWVKKAINFEQYNFSSRCEFCYTSRLEKVFEYAKENGYTMVTTTLLISPYQKHEVICKVCESLAQKYGVKFMYKDFRPMFWDGQNRAKALGLYRQKYCGCIFSEWESSSYNRNALKHSLPENFELLKRNSLEVKRIIDIKIINEILKEKDNGEPFGISNLENVDVFGLKKENEILSLIVVLHSSKQEVEIKEIITKKEYRHQGYGTKLLKSMCGNYKQKYKTMIIGTTGEHIPFFVKNGFTNFLKQENNILYYYKKLQDVSKSNGK